MQLTFVASIEVLVELSHERADSPEDFLLMLEDALENGLLTLEEVTQFLADFNN